MTTSPGNLVHALMAMRSELAKVAEGKADPGEEVFSPRTPIPPARHVSGRERKLADLDDLVKVSFLTARGMKSLDLEKLALSGAAVKGAVSGVKNLLFGAAKKTAPKVKALIPKAGGNVPPIPSASAVSKVKPVAAAPLPDSAYAAAKKMKIRQKVKPNAVQPEVAAPGSNWAPVPQAPAAAPPPIPAAASKKPALDLASSKAPIETAAKAKSKSKVVEEVAKEEKPKSLMRQLALPALVAGTGYGLYKGIPAVANIAQQSAAMPRAYGGGLQQYQYGYTPGGQAQF